MKNWKNNEKLVQQIVIIAGVFTALVGLLLILNYLQIHAGDPLNSAALKALVDRLSLEPDNRQLTDEVRLMDLLARKAYFTSLWQIKTGAYLMIFGAGIFVFALRVLYKIRFNIEEPLKNKLGEKMARQKTQRWIAVSGVGLLVLAGLSAVFTVNYLEGFDEKKIVNSAKTEASSIEQIDIGGSDTTALANDSTAAADSSEVIPLNEKTVWQQQNSFRGVWGNGVSSASEVPINWNGSTGKNIRWKTSIAIGGNSSPVVWGDRIFLTGAANNKRVVYCIDRNTGKILWEQAVKQVPGSPSVQPKTSDDTGLAAPTTTVDEKYVFAIFGNGDIAAFDHQGLKIWSRNLGVPANHYGHASSLQTWGGKVFVQYDTTNGSKVMALSSETGKNIWTTARTNDISWSSPILAKVNGKMQLILLANPNLSGYDINSGKQLWSVDCMSGEVGPSPAYGGGQVYAANEYAKMVAVNPSTGKIVWENSDKLPEVSSPVYYKGYVYVGTTYAVLACVDAKTGVLKWEYEAKGGFYSSPMIASGKLYIFDTTGKAYIFATGGESKLLSSPTLGEKVYATPAFSNGRIYIRGVRNLYCIGTK
ncbi:MAG TPA: PQQ-binding-like beta-propeller repeat protein [Bacteroidales bacterium]|nr:PQQ-binding-like beta-propeller repeat protein [Bacteroidales bacterium]